MDSTFEYQSLIDASAVLGDGIPVPAPSGELPLEVAETLARAAQEMRAVPAALETLQDARTEFAHLEQTIGRLLELAREASALPEENRAGRENLQAEFVELSHVVAHAAGRAEYHGPQLSLADRPRAKASFLVLKNMIPVLDEQAGLLDEQEIAILTAISQTVSFLETVAESFPQAPAAETLRNLLNRVRRIRVIGPGDSGSGRGLH